jgi:hypothetical protein
MNNQRAYTDNGFISKDACLNVLGDDGLFSLLIPVVSIPEHKSAPNTADKTVLTDHSMTYAEALQSVDQKTFTFNYHRDNLIQLNKHLGRTLTFLERNPDNTGERYTGTIAYGRGAESVNGIVQGNLYITVSSADDTPIIDARDLIKQTAIITTPLVDTYVVGTNSVTYNLETSANATIKATSDADTIATVKVENGNKVTITGVAKGTTLIRLETSATGEATSYRTIAVTVDQES